MQEKILLEALLQELEKYLQKTELAKGTIVNYKCHGISQIRECYRKSGRSFYSHTFNAQITSEASAKYEQKLISRSRIWGIRKVAALLDEYVATGQITLGRRRTGSKTLLTTKYYQDILSRYEMSEISCGIRTPATIECEKILVRHFFAHLESVNCKTLDRITLEETSTFLTIFSQSNPRSVGKMLGTLRKLYAFTMLTAVVCADFRPALIARPSPRRKLRPSLTKTQANGIVNSIDTSTSLGKRDYAILMIAKYLGVRSGDILNLKFDDICWEAYEVKYCQNKTGVAIVLPLPMIVGNAIADYILNGRPKSEDRHIFIRHITPLVKLGSASNIFRRYDPDWKFDRGSGFHSFRRSVASQMLNAGVAPDTVKGVLGQLKIDSLKPYSRISDVRLLSCALGLANMETVQEELC